MKTDRAEGMTLGRAGSRGLLWSVVFFSVFTNLLLLTGPLFMLQVYDRVLTSRSEETLTALFVLVAGLYLLYGLIEFARSRVMSRVGARVQSVFSGPTFGAVIARAARGGRDRTGTLNDLDAVRTVLSSPVVLSVMDLPWTPMFVAAIFVFHPMLGWLALAGGALIVALAVVNQAITGAATRDGLQRLAGASVMAQEAERSGDFLQAQGMVGAMRARWEEGQGEAMERSTRAADRTGAIASFTRAFRLFLQSAMLALGAWLVLRGEVTAGAMIAASIMLGRALAPVEQSVAQWQTIQRGRAAWRDLKTLLAETGSPIEPTRLPHPKARLEVKGVTVIVRRGEPPVLSQVSFACQPGEALGIIGRSGSGKTTLARVVVGLAEPAAGEVRLDGATLAQYGPEVLGGHIGYLPQEVCLFRGTVAENIAHMEAEPDAERLVAAAKKARVHDIILKLPDGYDTRIGPADAALSGGQRQRLALARALYRDPVLLVLDEPNSALDAEGSEALNAVVKAMKDEGRAVLIMTHRPTAISACDRLLVLDGGKVAAYGPRDDVVKSMMKNATDIQRVVTRETGR